MEKRKKGAPPPPWGEQRKRYRFHSIFHQVRNPLVSIPSLVTEISHWKRCESVLSEIIPSMDFKANVEHMALQIWVEWNSRLDSFPFIPVYRVEDFNLLELLRGINFNTMITEDDYKCAYLKYHGHNSRTNTSLHQQLTWGNVYTINQTLALRAMDMAYRYGYRYYQNSTMVKLSLASGFHSAEKSGSKVPTRKYHVFKSIPFLCNSVFKGTYVPPKAKKPKKSMTIPPLNLTTLPFEELSHLFLHPLFTED
jgi:hypothetical protein